MTGERRLLLQIIHALSDLAGNELLFSALLFAFAFINVYFPPIPLESAVLFGGYLAGAKLTSLWVIIGASVAGMFAGSLTLYILVRRFGIGVIDRTPLKRAIDSPAYLRAADWFRRYGLWAALLGKFVPGMSLCVVISLGTLRTGLRKTIPILFFSNLIFFALLAFVGYWLGDRWGEALTWLNKVGRVWVGGLVLVGVVLLGRVVWRRVR